MVEVVNRTAAAEAGERLHVRALFTIMAKVVTQENLVLVTELVVKAHRGKVFTRGEIEQSAIGFQLVHQETIARAM